MDPVVPAGVYTDFRDSPQLVLERWPAACERAAPSAPPPARPTATAFAVRMPTGIVAALGAEARESLRLAVEARVAALAGWTAVQASTVLAAERAERDALAERDRCAAPAAAGRVLARGLESVVVLDVTTRCFRAGVPCALSVAPRQLDANGAEVNTRLPSFTDAQVDGSQRDAWARAASTITTTAPMGVLVYGEPRLVGVHTEFPSPQIANDALVHALAPSALRIASCAQASMATTIELALAFAADGTVSACEAGVAGQATQLTRCACGALGGASVPPARETLRLAAAHFSLGAAPGSLAAGIDADVPQLAPGSLNSARVRDELARCTGVPAGPVVYEVDSGSRPRARVLSGRAAAPDATCILSALRAVQPLCAPLPPHLTLCVRPITATRRVR